MFTPLGVSQKRNILTLLTVKGFTLHKKKKFSIKDFFSKCDEICRKLRIWSHLLKKFIIENFIFLYSFSRITLATDFNCKRCKNVLNI